AARTRTSTSPGAGLGVSISARTQPAYSAASRSTRTARTLVGWFCEPALAHAAFDGLAHQAGDLAAGAVGLGHRGGEGGEAVGHRVVATIEHRDLGGPQLASVGLALVDQGIETGGDDDRGSQARQVLALDRREARVGR